MNVTSLVKNVTVQKNQFENRQAKNYNTVSVGGIKGVFKINVKLYPLPILIHLQGHSHMEGMHYKVTDHTFGRKKKYVGSRIKDIKGS